MSVHPNVILMLTLTPEGLSRKTMKAILEETKTATDEEIAIGNDGYAYLVMEDEYDESWQVSGKEGDLLIFDLVTYGYGEQISWEELEAKKRILEEWAEGISQRHNCSYKISVTANFW